MIQFDAPDSHRPIVMYLPDNIFGDVLKIGSSGEMSENIGLDRIILMNKVYETINRSGIVSISGKLNEYSSMCILDDENDSIHGISPHIDHFFAGARVSHCTGIERELEYNYDYQNKRIMIARASSASSPNFTEMLDKYSPIILSVKTLCDQPDPNIVQASPVKLKKMTPNVPESARPIVLSVPNGVLHELFAPFLPGILERLKLLGKKTSETGYRELIPRMARIYDICNMKGYLGTREDDHKTLLLLDYKRNSVYRISLGIEGISTELRVSHSKNIEGNLEQMYDKSEKVVIPISDHLPQHYLRLLEKYNPRFAAVDNLNPRCEFFCNFENKGFP